MRRKPPKAPIINDDDDVNLMRHKKKLHLMRKKRQLRRIEIAIARFRALSRLIFFVLLSFLLFKLVNLSQWYINPGIFAYYPNNYLEIEGNAIIKTGQIMNVLSGIKLPDKPLYLLDTNIIEKPLLKLSPIKKVYIRRFWFPARLKIVVDERIPILAITPSIKVPPFAVFTEDNTLIGKDFLPLPDSKTVYKVLTYDDYTKWSSRHVNYLVRLSSLIETVTRKKLLYLDIRNPSDVFAQLSDIRLRLGEFDHTVFNRAKRVGDMLPEAIKFKENISYIDLRWNKSISIKLKSKEEQLLEKQESEEASDKNTDKSQDITNKKKEKPKKNKNSED